MEFKVVLKSQHDKALPALFWAKDNCKSYVRNDGYDDDEGESVYIFYFSNESDATLFALKWL